MSVVVCVEVKGVKGDGRAGEGGGWAEDENAGEVFTES